MKDTVTRALVLGNRVNIIVASTTNLVSTAQTKHQLWPTSAAALGRTLSMGVIMGIQQKNENDVVTIKIDGDGPIEQIRVDAKANGDVKGYVLNKEVFLMKEGENKLDVGAAIGEGTLTVSKNYGLKNEYSSQVQLVSGEIGEDFAYYYTQSEQLPSAVSVGVLIGEDYKVKSAGALLIQMLPDHTEQDILIVEDIIRNLKPMSQLILEGYEPDDLIDDLFDDAEILLTKEVQFECDCTKEKMEKILMTMPVSDLIELRDEDHEVTLECHFCSEFYTFNEDEINTLIDQITHA